jgi:hypothetical protein
MHAIADQRDAARRHLIDLRGLADEVLPFAYSAPHALPPDATKLAIAVVELAHRRYSMPCSTA